MKISRLVSTRPTSGILFGEGVAILLHQLDQSNKIIITDAYVKRFDTLSKLR